VDVMTEKYIAMFQNIAVWSDYKRTCIRRSPLEPAPPRSWADAVRLRGAEREPARAVAVGVSDGHDRSVGVSQLERPDPAERAGRVTLGGNRAGFGARVPLVFFPRMPAE